MFHNQTLKASIQQQLMLGSGGLLAMFDTLVTEYEEKLLQQRQLLDNVTNIQQGLHSADTQLPLEKQEEAVPERQVRRPSLEVPHITEEVPTDMTNYSVTPVSVKREDDDETPRFSQLHHAEEMESEDDGDSDFNPDNCTSGDEWEEMSEEPDWNTGTTPDPSSEFAPSFGHNILTQELTGLQSRLRYKCCICGRKYTRRASIIAHMRSHSEENSSSSSACNEMSVFMANLEGHSQSHTEERPFSCSRCGKGFTRSSNLSRHMRIHTGEKPFGCPVCRKGFTRSSNLSRHMRIHTRVEPLSS